MEKDPEILKLYPIQAAHIAPRELYIKANVPPSDTIGVQDDTEFDLSTGHSDYDPDDKMINIAVRIEVGAPDTTPPTTEVLEQGPEKEVPPFHLRVELLGIFEVDDAVFPADKIYDWAKVNALFIMYPYLREHVFALTARMGFRPMLLPLVEVPLFRIPPPSTETKLAEPLSE